MVRWPPIHCDDGQEPDLEIGPRAAQVDGVEAELVQRRLGALDLVHPLAPCGDRVAARRRGRCARPAPTAAASAASASRSGWTSAAQPARRARDRRPVEACRGHVLERLAAPGREIAPDPVGIGAVEQPGRDRARQADRGAAVLAVLADHLHDPPRLVSQRLVDRVVEAGPLHPGVAVGDVHEHRSGPVTAGGDCAGELLLPDRRADVHSLPGLDVRAEVDDEVGHLLERAGVHGATVPHPAILPTCPLHAERRYLTLAGLAAGSAAAAHGGWAEVSDPRWAGAAAAGAALAAAGLAWTGALASAGPLGHR